MEAAVNLAAAQKETLRLQFLAELDTEFYNKKTTLEDLTFFRSGGTQQREQEDGFI